MPAMEIWSEEEADSSVKVLQCASMLARYGVWLMTTYLTDVWQMKLANAAAIVNVQEGMTGVLGIGMAFIQDTCFGQYRTALLSSVSYAVGLGLLSLSVPPMLSNAVGTCNKYESACIGDVQKGLFYTGLVLIVLGASGHSSAVPSTWSKKMKLKRITFVLIVPLVGVIALPYVKPWAVRFGVPAIVMVVGTIVFWLLSRQYTPDQPNGSPLTCVVRVLVASWLKALFHYKPEVDLHGKQNAQTGELCARSEGYRWLDKAAIIEPTKDIEQQKENRWRLCTVTEVEETKVLLRLVPVWMTFIVCGVVMSTGSTYFLEQGNTMNRKIGSLKFPLPILLMLSDTSKSQAIKFYKFLARDSNKKVKKYAPPIGIGVGMIFSILCCVTAALVEKKRINVVKEHGLSDKPGTIPLSMFLLVPQFIFLGFLIGLSREGIKGFFHDQVPDSMTKYMSMFTDAVIGAGTTSSALLVYVTGKITGRGTHSSWFGQTLNHSHLDYYYWMLAVFSCINLVLFVFVAYRYPYKEAKEDEEEQEGKDLTNLTFD